MSLIESLAIPFVIGVFSSIVAMQLGKWIAGRYSTRFSFHSVLNSTLSLYRMIQADEYVPDYIIAVNRNGCIVGSILGGHFGTKTVMAVGTESARTAEGRRRSELSPAHLPRDGVLRGKKILIFSCFNDTGTALETVYDYYSSMRNGPAEIRTAALFTSVGSRFVPKYYVIEVGKDVRVSMNQILPRMPWMTKDWKYVFGVERFSKDA